MSAGARRVVLAANWKMNLVASDVDAYFDEFWRVAPAPDPAIEVLFFPPAPLLIQAVQATRGEAEVGGQNCHWEPAGAFTGEVSAPMIHAAGARHVLVGHSERRHLFGETDEQCAMKIRAALDAKLSPLLCVGEMLDERDQGRQRAVVIRQLSRALDGLAGGALESIRVAYEPVWAIGTGRTAAPADAQEMHAAIRETLVTIAGARAARGIPILYGGSVKPNNVEALVAESDVDGALVGGASLDPRGFAAIVAGGRKAMSALR